MYSAGMMGKQTLASLIIILLLSCIATSAVGQDADTWQHELTIYGWYAGVDGEVQYPGGPGSGADISVEASDIIENLNMVLMGGWQSKYNRWSIIADVVFMDVGDDASKAVTAGPAPGVPVNASLDMDLSSWILSGGVGYDLVQSDKGTLALIGGVRYLTVDVDVSLGIQGPFPFGAPPAAVSDSESLLDGIIGVSGYVQLGENWYLPYHADIGGGGSDLSWQLFAAIGYRFSWGDIRLGYRYLKVEMDDDMVLKDLELSGPVLGVGFTF